MRDYRIRIAPFHYIALQKLNINQEINEHATATVSMLIHDENQDDYLHMLARGQWVCVTAVGEDTNDQKLFFGGIATSFSSTKSAQGTLLNIELSSKTIQMDIERHFRVFQQEEALCSSIYEKIAQTYENGHVVINTTEAWKLSGCTIQYQKTDWAFLKRLASKYGQYITPDMSTDSICYTVGLPQGALRALETSRMHMKYCMDEYQEKFQNGRTELLASDFLELIVKSREICQIGDYIDFEGKVFYIYKIETQYVKSECEHLYYLRSRRGLCTLESFDEGVAGCSFEAVVEDIWRDAVQISIVGDEWKGQDGRKWYPYGTVYASFEGTGWYCMPEKGDRVRLYVPDREENSFVLNAVQRESDAARQNPDHKIFKTAYGKELRFTPDSIVLTNNKGMSIEMDDAAGIKITSDKKIEIMAQDQVSIESRKQSLMIAADDKVQIRRRNTAMVLDDDITFTGGEYRIQ